MKFAKPLLVIIPIVALLAYWFYPRHVDRTDAAAVATAFTKAFHAGDTTTASTYFLPGRAEAWHTATDAYMDKMKSAASRNFLTGIPANPTFTPVPPAAGKPVSPDVMTLKSAEGYTLGLTRSSGQWYVSKSPT